MLTNMFDPVTESETGKIINQPSLEYIKKELAYLVILRQSNGTSKISPKNATLLCNVLKSKMSNSGIRGGL